MSVSRWLGLGFTASVTLGSSQGFTYVGCLVFVSPLLTRMIIMIMLVMLSIGVDSNGVGRKVWHIAERTLVQSIAVSSGFFEVGLMRT